MKKIILLLSLFLGLLSLEAHENHKIDTTARHHHMSKPDFFTKRNISRLNGVIEEDTVITIPVVFHILHKSDEDEGVGRNISDADILAQLEVLNEDFRRTNPDAINTPTMFQSCLLYTSPSPRDA